MVKFLIIRFSSIGDIVLTTPAIRCLKQQVEDAEVHFLTKKAFLPVVEKNPYIDKIYTLEKSLSAVTKELKKEEYDYIIDLHHNLRTLRIKQSLRRLTFAFNKLNYEKWLMVQFKINRLPDIHIVDRYLKTLDLFDVHNDEKGLDFFSDVSREHILETLPTPFREGYIGLVIGAKHNTKQLPDEKLISLITKLNHPVVLLGGKEDAARGESIASALKGNAFNGCGKYSLHESAALVKEARLIITHDTGLMHIASAYKKTILSIWGNTIPEFGMYPYLPGEGSEIFEVKGLKCRPCTKIGYKKCPKGHFNCMNLIDLEAIASKANRLFSEVSTRI